MLTSTKRTPRGPGRPRRRCLRALGVLACGFVATLATAQTTAPEFDLDALDSLDLPEAVVVANRSPVARQSVGHTFDILSRAQLEELPVSSVAEALQYVPGLDVRQRGPRGVQADLSVRGGTFDQVLILLNGVELSDPQTGHHALNIPVPLENVERIEVLKGPGARLYGQNAFAGAINIVTRPGAERRTSLRAKAGGYGLGGFGASLDAPAGPLRQTISYQRDFSDGYRENTDYTLAHAFYQGEVATGRDVLGLTAGLVDRAFGANGFYASPSATQQYEEITTGLVALSHRREARPGDGGSFSQRLSYRRNRDDYVFIRSNPSVYQNIHTSQVIGWDGYQSLPTSLGRLGLAGEVRGVWLESNNLGDRSRLTSSLLVEHAFDLADGRLTLTPGISSAYISDLDLVVVLPGLDARYDFGGGLNAYGNAGATYRVPTYTDLYYADPFNEGNPDLKTEYAAAYELGLSYDGPALTGGLAVWRREATDLIDYVRDSAADSVWQPRNFTEATFQGLEAKVAVRRRYRWLPLVSLSYAYIDAQLPGDEGEAISRYALDNLVHQITAQAVAKPARQWSTTLALRVGDRVTEPFCPDDTGFSTCLDADYALLDLRVDYRRRSVGAFAEVTNLTDALYTQANLVPLPGRWWRVGAQVSW